jgi:preprotein translocase subunit SecD
MALRRSHLIAVIAAAVAVCAIAAVLVTVVLRQVTRPSGETTMTVEAAAPADGPTLDRTRRVLLARLAGAGMSDGSVTVEGNRRLVVRVAGHQPADRMRALAAPGDLQFRTVLGATTNDPRGDEEVAGGTGQPTLEQVRAKLGRVYELASTATKPEDLPAETVDQLAPFASLSADEVAVLPAVMRYVVPFVGCKKLAARIAAPAGEQVTACEASAKYLLDRARVVGTDVRKAEAAIDPQTGQWQVNIAFTGAGQAKWTDLTRELSPDQGRVAIMVDGVVLSAPAIQSVITGDAVISGGFTRATAQGLAAQLSGGTLPVRLTVVNVA